MAGPGSIDNIIRAIAPQAETPKYIRAYHGSPYDFDRFDASRINTGEGAQSYGHGLYFAGNEKVAVGYRDSLKGLVDLPVPDELDAQLMQVISEIGQLSGQRGKVVGGEWDALQKQLDQKQDLLMALQHQYRAAAQNPGHMYEVEIPHPAEALLDYDRPFSTPVGRLALSAVGDMLPAPPSRSLTRDLRQGMGVEAAPRPGSRNAFDNAAGQLIDLAKTPSGAGALLDAGIPGVRYLDGNSRSAGRGTRNYVMFPGTEDSIRILRKYGLLAPIAAGAAVGDE